MKKLGISTLLLILIPTVLFAPFYGLMIHSAKVNRTDFRQELSGTWEAFQYYIGTERVACTPDHGMSVSFRDGTVKVEGQILSGGELADPWLGSSSFQWGAEVIYVDFDSHGNLKLSTGDSGYIILLRTQGG